jgi:hypothetical protein
MENIGNRYRQNYCDIYPQTRQSSNKMMTSINDRGNDHCDNYLRGFNSTLSGATKSAADFVY